MSNFKRETLLEQLASVQVKPTELSMYSSVKSIGQREKRKLLPFTVDNLGKQKTEEDRVVRKVNSIAGSNRKKFKSQDEENESCSASSIDTDDMSSDDEIDQVEIDKAVEKFKKRVEQEENKEAERPKKEVEPPAELSKNKENGSVVNKRATKYVHVERREEIQVK